MRNTRDKLLEGFADIGYNASKRMWFYTFTVHMAVTESGYILNHIVTPASVHDLQAC
ncbi:transposase [Streptococcus orisratti]|uniref:transposase n=1 Tax=Streptococcus orisratti TaxID=114652 RepID=UPI003CCC41F0